MTVHYIFCNVPAPFSDGQKTCFGGNTFPLSAAHGKDESVLIGTAPLSFCNPQKQATLHSYHIVKTKSSLSVKMGRISVFLQKYPEFTGKICVQKTVSMKDLSFFRHRKKCGKVSFLLA